MYSDGATLLSALVLYRDTVALVEDRWAAVDRALADMEDALRDGATSRVVYPLADTVLVGCGAASHILARLIGTDPALEGQYALAAAEEARLRRALAASRAAWESHQRSEIAWQEQPSDPGCGTVLLTTAGIIGVALALAVVFSLF